MTVLQLRAQADPDDRLERVRRALDLAAVVARGWDPERHIFSPSPDDPLFGWSPCGRVGCHRAARKPSQRQIGLCETCLCNYRLTYQGQLSISEYKELPYRRPAGEVQALCLVCRTPGHQRAASSMGLCEACAKLRRSRGVSVDAFVAGDDRYPPATPRPTMPVCEVAGCEHWVHSGGLGLCGRCHTRWSHHKRPPVEAFKRAGLPRLSPDGRQVDLAGLPALVEAQLLLGIQRIMRLELRVSADSLERIVRRLRDDGIEDVAGGSSDASMLIRGKVEMRVLRVIVEAAGDATTDVEAEFQRDVWNVRVLYPATHNQSAAISFVEISQRWLRELTKAWCQRRSVSVAETTLGHNARCTRRLSRFLAALPHGGERPELLTREDLECFLRWEYASTTPWAASTELGQVRELLRFARRYGHTAPGGIAGGLGEQFSLLDEDVRSPSRMGVSASRDYEPGKALPEYVLHQLLEPATLELLTNQDARVIFQLLAHTGRRPIEICALGATCLEWAERSATGPSRPLLRYKREKPPKKELTLPITAEAAELIQRQQAAVLARYPGHALSDLKLFPRANMNGSGRQPVAPRSLQTMLRRWVDGLSLVTVDGEVFPSAAVHAYALRHSYAQRHADSVDPVVPVDVLQKLMDHRSIQTTQGYYRVREERLHEAVRASAPLTINRDGVRVGGTEYPDAERITRSVGRIPVPLGHCVEPHNVKALGSACPFSHQCLGCVHFRTDPSHLPDLYAYLEQLLDARERLNAAVPQLRDWAREKAVPNDAEIKAVRNLIRSNEELLAELEPDERRKLGELFAALRAARAQAENRLAIHQVGAIAQPEPTFSPPLVGLTAAGAGRAG